MFQTKFKPTHQAQYLNREELAGRVHMPAIKLVQIEEDKNAKPICETAMLKICHIPPKGRGVIATQPIPAGTVAEIAPVRSFSAKNRPLVDQTEIFEYYFVKPSAYRESKEIDGHFIFGLSTFCNHANRPNAKVEWHTDDLGEWAYLVALRDIAVGEEITLYYTNVDEYPNMAEFV